VANLTPGRRPLSAAFDPAGRRLVMGNADGGVTVCDLNTIRNRLRELNLGW